MTKKYYIKTKSRITGEIIGWSVIAQNPENALKRIPKRRFIILDITSERRNNGL